MDIEQFGEFKTGRIVPIEVPRGRDWSFVPNHLPPAWSMSSRLWQLVAQARHRIGELNGIGNNLPHPRLLLRPLQRREALRSSSLEGTYVTPKQLLLFEKSMKEPEAREVGRENQWLEVFNYYRALRAGHKRLQQGKVLDRTLFCDLHKLLLTGVRGRDKFPGQVRDRQVHVGVDGRYNPPPASELSECLTNLESFLTGDHGDYDPLVRAFIAHYQFEAIHPFTDGNGRIGRLLLSLTISRWLDLSRPWLYLSEFYENHRKDYIDCLFRVSTNGEWDRWIEFCLKGTIEQAELSIKRCHDLEALRKDYKSRVGHESSRMHNIIDNLFSQPVVSIVDIKNKFEVSYHTAKSDIQKLVDANIIHRMEGEYPKQFAAEEILRVAYVD